MRRNVWMVLSLAVMTWAVLASRARAQGGPEAGGPAPVATPNPAAAATPGPPANAGPAADAGQMQQLIKLWALQSGRLKSLDVEMTRVDEDPAWGEPERYEGRAMFKSPNLAWIDFKRVTVNGKDQKVLTPHERIICTGRRSGSTVAWRSRSGSSTSAARPGSARSSRDPCRSCSTSTRPRRWIAT